MKKLLLVGLLAIGASACATSGALADVESGSGLAVPSATSSSEELNEAAKPCDERCAARRREELERLRKLGTLQASAATK
jgi:hypothetical protein